MVGEAGDKANAAASKIIRFYRKASTLFRRSTAFRNEANTVCDSYFLTQHTLTQQSIAVGIPRAARGPQRRALK